MFRLLVLVLSSLVSKPCFLSFSTQNHAESSGNYIKKYVLDPKRAKLDQQFCGHFTESLRKSHGKFTDFLCNYFKYMFTKISFLASRHCFLIVLTCSWVFWPKNDIERIWNFLKKPVLDPKREKFDQKSPFGVSGGQGFPPKIPPSYRVSREISIEKQILL